jgi:hypothetical protein
MTSSICPRCAGTNGHHGKVHVRHGNGGGHNEPCPNTPPAPAADPYPEHTRQAAVLDEAEAIGRFLDESGYILAEYREIEGYREEQLMPVSTPVQNILARYFGIDLAKIDAEKRAMIAALAGA